MKSGGFENEKIDGRRRKSSSSSSSRSRSRSRDKKIFGHSDQGHLYLRKFESSQKKLGRIQDQDNENGVINFSRGRNNLIEENTENDRFKEVVRSLLRIQQGRQEMVDKFAKIVWIFKDRIKYDHDVHEIMVDPNKLINRLEEKQIEGMLTIAQKHRQYQIYKKSKFQQYWNCIITILNFRLQKLSNTQTQIKDDYKYKVQEIIKKPLPELIKLQRQASLILKTQNFGSGEQYWRYVLEEVSAKKIQLILHQFYQEFKESHQDIINQSLKQEQNHTYQEPTSPVLLPFTAVNSKLVVDEDSEREARKKLAEKIFKEQFQKGQERLENNLSIPHNHSLLSTEIVTEQTGTYDQITKEIIEFEKYKRMEEDQEEFNDWVPCQNEGRFRDKKPFYINKVRVACEWNKYTSTHYSEENPPPKTIQGYKFNIFYPQLYDKQKTPQYYLQGMDDPNYCLITFKAGPPYKDIAFKILKKEWEFTLKSGFESIFSKGILQLYFNFKKPKYRI